MWFFQDLIRRKVYSRIDYKFLIAGHTYGFTDQTFGMIERYATRIDTVYTPVQWYQHVSDAGHGAKSVQVVEMEQDYFYDFRQHLRKMYTDEPKMKTSKILISIELFGLILGREKRKSMAN